MIKKILLIATILFSLSVSAISSKHGLDGYAINTIDASKNARLHSNMGNLYFSEKKYVGALQEYEIAFNLSPNSLASATYLYNISRCYIKLGDYSLAKSAILGAIEKDSINMIYYETLVDCYINLKIEKTELKKHLKDSSNPYNRIIAGLIYLKTNKIENAKMIFDDFINQNPNMIITQDVKFLLKKLNN